MPRRRRSSDRSRPAWAGHRKIRVALLAGTFQLSALGAPIAPTTTPEATSPSRVVNSAAIDRAANPQSARLLVDLINVVRARADVPPLFIDSDLMAAARDAQNTNSTASTSSPAALIADRLDMSWTRAGEIRGYAPSVIDYLDAVLASEDHRSLVMDPSFTRVGLIVDLDDQGATVRQLLADG